CCITYPSRYCCILADWRGPRRTQDSTSGPHIHILRSRKMRTDRIALRKCRRVCLPSKRAKKLAMLSAAAISIIQIESTRAQLYWDLNGPTSGAGGTTPAGTWDNLTPKWNATADGTGAAMLWSAGSSAVFSAGSDA